jgi:hypothetical protein
MKSTKDAILIAILVVLVIIVVYQGSGWFKKGGACDGFAAAKTGPLTQFPEGTYNPYTLLNKQIDELRGYRNDGYNQPPVWRLPQGLDRYHRSGASLTPEDVAEAEREQWFSATDADQSGAFNTELSQDPTSDTMMYHTPSPALDYGSYITDLISDPRTRENHRRWVEEMKPWSGVAMKVDNLEMDNYVDFIGLRRPQAVAQYNPLQLTEIDTWDLAVNPKFNFRG